MSLEELEELVVQFPNCEEDEFMRVFGPRIYRTAEEMGEKWEKLMQAFERQGLLKSRSALSAMFKAPISQCRADVYSWYFQVIGTGDLTYAHRQMVNLLWKKGGDERKVFAGICRWCSKDEVEIFVDTYNDQSLPTNMYIGLYWSADRPDVFNMLKEKIMKGPPEFIPWIAGDVMRLVAEFMPDARKARPAGALGITPRDFRKWEGDNANKLQEEMWETYKREVNAVAYLSRIDKKIKETINNFTLFDVNYPSLLGRACERLAFPLANFLATYKYKYQGKLLEVPDEEDSLLEKVIYVIFRANYKSPSSQKAATSSTSRSFATPHAQLQAHAKELLEISQSLASLLRK